MKLRMGFVAIMLASVIGCAQTTSTTTATALMNLAVVKPDEPDMRYQVEIAKINELLANEAELSIPTEGQADLKYRRGSLYDALGLYGLARYDFHQALEHNPRLASAYNYLGIHYTAIQEYGYAYEMFDAVLELDPEHPYGVLNRALTSYYDDRIDWAIKDFNTALEQSPNDAYRVIWLYFAEAEKDPATARLNLAKRRLDFANQEWGWYLVDLILGAIDDDRFIQEYALRELSDDETPAERMCETYFYLGKLRQLDGDFATAEVYFRMALSTHVPFFLEYRYANLELHRTALAREASAQSE
ncbi:lipoprotein NlpI [Pseudidiomarina indica]|uniref:Lipoprotein NlpI n=1 Tax=Pseudidiomarina indica TaxID=1159017 RepID=A0A1G6DLA5_9GAMM|nr:lipoprotein NlpI [Pseudidiomarina indica]SDB45974.1 lipoprotein NlpI [Pseudidiomarina indica]